MSPAFAAQKTKFLQQLTAPDASGTNRLSESGVDVGIRKLVDEINKIDTLATTGSCAGRVVVYLEGRSSSSPGLNLDDDMGISGLAIAAEGDSSQSLFVSHDPLPLSGKRPVAPMLGLSDHTNLSVPSSIEGVRWVRCKFESMVGHTFVFCFSTDLLFHQCFDFRKAKPTSVSPELMDNPDAASVMLLAGVRTQSKHSSLSIWFHGEWHLKHINRQPPDIHRHGSSSNHQPYFRQCDRL
jgi:hypothetical protein